MRRIDVYIEQDAKTKEYDMWFYYNGKNFEQTMQDEEARSFAAKFKKFAKGPKQSYGYLSTRGITDYEDESSILYKIKGLEAIEESLILLVNTCIKAEIQSDLVVHIGEREHKLVGEIDGKTYLPKKSKSHKGDSVDELLEVFQFLEKQRIELEKEKEKTA